jgi:hypothetical protein
MKDDISKRIDNVNCYIYAKTYIKFLSIVIDSISEDKKKKREINEMINAIGKILDGKDIKVCATCLSFMINSLFTSEESLLSALEMINDSIENKEHRVDVSYI